jgi:hypothetical protein
LPVNTVIASIWSGAFLMARLLIATASRAEQDIYSEQQLGLRATDRAARRIRQHLH